MLKALERAPKALQLWSPTTKKDLWHVHSSYDSQYSLVTAKSRLPAGHFSLHMVCGQTNNNFLLARWKNVSFSKRDFSWNEYSKVLSKKLSI